MSNELYECKQEAGKSKAEVERVFTEIEKYAQILEVMEARVSEADDRVIMAEKMRDEAIKEIQAIR